MTTFLTNVRPIMVAFFTKATKVAVVSLVPRLPWLLTLPLILRMVYGVWYAGCTLHTRQSSTQSDKYQVSHRYSYFTR
jgi:hypothetical protein